MHSVTHNQKFLVCCNCAIFYRKLLAGFLLTQPGLPDGIFPNQKTQFGYFLEGLGMEKFSTFYGHVSYT
jgi:hypothetical protein